MDSHDTWRELNCWLEPADWTPELSDPVTRFPSERARPPAQRPEPFKPFYVAEMEGREPKPREWLIDGVLPRRTVILFAGPPKIGKSLLIQQMLTALSVGQSWLGRECLQSRSFGLFCEDPQEELERRQSDINFHYGVTAGDFETEYSWQSRDGKEAVLCEFERFSDRPKWTDLWHQLVTYVKDEGIKVVALDTAATCFAGNENFRNHTTGFLRGLQKLAIEIDGAVILSAHPSRSTPNSYSGSTAWLASVRAGLSLGRPVDYDPETNEPRHVRVLRGLGTNYGAGVGAERLEFDHGVLVPTEPEQRLSGKRWPLTAIERNELKYRLLMGLKKVLQNGGKIPADVEKRDSMPNRARRSTDPQINRVSLNDLNLAQEELLDSGQIVRVSVNRQCLIRPHDSGWYDNEEPWLPARPPAPPLKEAADD